MYTENQAKLPLRTKTKELLFTRKTITADVNGVELDDRHGSDVTNILYALQYQCYSV